MSGPTRLPSSRPRRSGPGGVAVFASVSAATVSAAAAVFTAFAGRSRSGTSWQAVFLVVFVSLSAVVFYLVIQRLGSVRRLGLRLAITGPPEAGKTVFSVLLFDLLMNGHMDGVDFTPDARTAISVHQAIRTLPADVWPARTVPGVVSTYSGTIEASRRVIELEVGDSAGEYWLDLERSDELHESYVEYVISADAMAHVIPLKELVSRDTEKFLASELGDLHLVARLKARKDGRRKTMSLIIVLSKADLAIDDKDLLNYDSGLFTAVPMSGLLDLPIMDDAAVVSSRVREWLTRFNDSLMAEYRSVDFVISSTRVVTENRLTGEHSKDLMNWILDKASAPE